MISCKYGQEKKKRKEKKRKEIATTPKKNGSTVCIQVQYFLEINKNPTKLQYSLSDEDLDGWDGFWFLAWQRVTRTNAVKVHKVFIFKICKK